MRFKRTYINKLVSFADRYFTYDWRKMRREDASANFDFSARNDDTKTRVVIDRVKCGIFVCIRKDNKILFSKILHTYKEVAYFKRMIRCLG